MLMSGAVLFGGKIKMANLQAPNGALLKRVQLIFHLQKKIICSITESKI